MSKDLDNVPYIAMKVESKPIRPLVRVAGLSQKEHSKYFEGLLNRGIISYQGFLERTSVDPLNHKIEKKAPWE